MARQPPGNSPPKSGSPRLLGETEDGRTVDLTSSNVVNSLVHLYRAEMGRLTTYRVRLDTTTNWAITTSALVISFSFTNSQIPHTAILLVLLIDFFFLHLEARRFRAYEASRYRVYLLERSFFPQMLGDSVDPQWASELVAVLRRPGLTVNALGALGWRLRRNYVWIYAAVLVCWVGKLVFQAVPVGPAAAVEHAGVAGIPGPLVVVLVGSFAAGLLVLAASARRIYPFGDEGAREVMEQVVDH
jgi:uncharacterized membrane protein